MVKKLTFSPLVVVLLVLLQWDVLGSDYYLVQLLFYNYRLLLNKDQEIKIFHTASFNTYQTKIQAQINCYTHYLAL